MPIEGRTVDECVAQFRNVISKLFQRVLHKTKVVRAHQLGHRFLIGYIDDAGEVQPVRLARGQGAAPLFVRLWQEVEVYEPGSEAVTKGKRKGSSDRRLRLGTLAYNYHVATSEGPDAEPELRWEYVKFRQSGASPYCRNHLQGRSRDVYRRE